MGERADYQPHKLFVAALFAGEVDADRVRSLVEETFGRADAILPARPFRFSTYYDAEMGVGLSRTILSVAALADPSRLADFKIASNRIERDASRPDGSRTLNLDPGLLSLSRVMLATTKPSSHRVPLRDGLYAEITLLYRHGRYTPLEWTYPDFQSDAFVDWLGELRRRYREQLRELDASRSWRL